MSKHVHYDLIVEWAKDPDHPWQFRRPGGVWNDCFRCDPEWSPSKEYRKKPREFKEGYWYPCVRGYSCMLIYRDGHFRMADHPHYLKFTEEDFDYIGEGCLPDFGDNND